MAVNVSATSLFYVSVIYNNTNKCRDSKQYTEEVQQIDQACNSMSSVGFIVLQRDSSPAVQDKGESFG